jgi:hypothetical protein
LKSLITDEKRHFYRILKLRVVAIKSSATEVSGLSERASVFVIGKVSAE